MARYRVTEKSFIHSRLFNPGDEIEYDGVPGSSLVPLDEEAHAAVAAKRPPRKPGLRAHDGSRGKPPSATMPFKDAASRPLADIPPDWRELSKQQRIALAHKLGATSKGLTAEHADSLIQDELARRATV